jgi:hypothetical protein
LAAVPEGTARDRSAGPAAPAALPEGFDAAG